MMKIVLWIKYQLGRASRTFKLICDSHIIFQPTYLERKFSGERSVIFPYAVSLDYYDRYSHPLPRRSMPYVLVISIG